MTLVMMQEQGKRRAKARRAAVFGASLFAVCAMDASAKVDITPSISVRQVFADGVDGTSGIEAYTIVAPGIAASVEGQRASAFLNYNYNRRIAWGEGGGNNRQKGAHSLTARGDLEVAQDLLYLSAGGLITSVSRDRRGPISLNPDLNVFNQTHVMSGYITPSIRHRFGAFATAELAYTLRGFATNDDDRFLVPDRGGNEFDFALPSAGDSYGHDVSLRIGSGESFRRLRWTLTNSFSHDRRDVLNEVFRTYQTVLDGEYALSRSISLLGSIGYDDTRSTSDTSFTNTTRFVSYNESGVVYDGGLRWSPSRRTDVSVRVGRRFGSTTINSEANWAPASGLRLSAAYNDTIDTFGRLFTTQIGGISISQLQSGGARNSRIGVANLIGIDPLTNLPFIFGSQSINNATTRARTGQLSLSLDRRNWSGNATVFADRRRLLSFVPLPGQPPVDPRVFTEEDISIGGSASLTRTLNPRASWSVNGTVVRSKFALSSNREDWLYGASVGYNHRLNDTLSASAALSHSNRNSNVNGSDQKDTALTLGLRATF